MPGRARPDFAQRLARAAASAAVHGPGRRVEPGSPMEVGMRVSLFLAAATAAAGVAGAAAAQWPWPAPQPQPQPYPYGQQPYAQPYGQPYAPPARDSITFYEGPN